MVNRGDFERSEAVINALAERLAETYDTAEFSIQGPSEARGWVRNGPPGYVQGSGQFLIVEVHPSSAPSYRFMIQREDSLDDDSHENVLVFIQRKDFSDFERTDGEVFYYQFIPQWRGAPGHIREWEAGELHENRQTDL